MIFNVLLIQQLFSTAVLNSQRAYWAIKIQVIEFYDFIFWHSKCYRNR